MHTWAYRPSASEPTKGQIKFSIKTNKHIEMYRICTFSCPIHQLIFRSECPSSLRFICCCDIIAILSSPHSLYCVLVYASITLHSYDNPSGLCLFGCTHGVWACVYNVCMHTFSKLFIWVLCVRECVLLGRFVCNKLYLLCGMALCLWWNPLFLTSWHENQMPPAWNSMRWHSSSIVHGV